MQGRCTAQEVVHEPHSQYLQTTLLATPGLLQDAVMYTPIDTRAQPEARGQATVLLLSLSLHSSNATYISVSTQPTNNMGTKALSDSSIPQKGLPEQAEAKEFLQSKQAKEFLQSYESACRGLCQPRAVLDAKIPPSHTHMPF